VANNKGIVSDIINVALREYDPAFDTSVMQGILTEKDIPEVSDEILGAVNAAILERNNDRTELSQALSEKDPVTKEPVVALGEIENLKKQPGFYIRPVDNTFLSKAIKDRISNVFGRQEEAEREMGMSETGEKIPLNDEQFTIINRAATNVLNATYGDELIKKLDIKDAANLGDDEFIKNPVFRTLITDLNITIRDHNDDIRTRFLSAKETGYFLPGLSEDAVRDKKRYEEMLSLDDKGEYKDETGKKVKLSEAERNDINSKLSDVNNKLNEELQGLISKLSVPELNDEFKKDVLVNAKNRRRERLELNSSVDKAISALHAKYDIPGELDKNLRNFFTAHPDYIDVIVRESPDPLEGPAEEKLNEHTTFIQPGIYIFDVNKAYEAPNLGKFNVNRNEWVPYTKEETDKDKKALIQDLAAAGLSQPHNGKYYVMASDWDKFVKIIADWAPSLVPEKPPVEETVPAEVKTEEKPVLVETPEEPVEEAIPKTSDKEIVMKKEAVYFNLFKEFDVAGSPWALNKEQGVISKIDTSNIKESDLEDAVKNQGLWQYRVGDQLQMETETSTIPVTVIERLPNREYKIQTTAGNTQKVKESQLFSGNSNNLFK
jgi:ribosome-associated translation inhibitor RaiA